MLVEAGYTQAAIDAKITAAYNQLYVTGDPATQKIYYEVAEGNGTAYVSDMKNKGKTDTLSHASVVLFSPITAYHTYLPFSPIALAEPTRCRCAL